MIKTINTFIEFGELVNNKSFNEILGMAKANINGFELITDVDDFNNNEIKCCVAYKDVRVIVELAYDFELGKVVKFDKFTSIIEVGGNEIDWADREEYALNNSTKEFENCSGIKRYFKVLADKISSDMANNLDANADYILYKIGTMEKVGWIIVID